MALGLGQCTIEDCTSNYTNLALISFADTANRATQILEITWDSVYAMDADTGIYGPAIGELWPIPLNPGSDTTVFIFQNYNDTDGSLEDSDTMWLRYQTVERLLGLECGVDISFRKLEVYETTFDSAYVSDSIVTFDTEENIILYLLKQ